MSILLGLWLLAPFILFAASRHRRGAEGANLQFLIGLLIVAVCISLLLISKGAS